MCVCASVCVTYSIPTQCRLWAIPAGEPRRWCLVAFETHTEQAIAQPVMMDVSPPGVRVSRLSFSCVTA